MWAPWERPSLISVSEPNDLAADRRHRSAAVTTLAGVIDVARRSPDSGVVDADGVHRGWTEIADSVDRAAAALCRSGARRGDRVAVLLPKSVDSFIAMHAILRAGLVAVPLNPLSTKRALRPTIEATAPNVLIVSEALADRLIDDDLDLHETTVFIVGGSSGDATPFRALHSWSDAISADVGEVDLSTSAPAPDDDAYIIFTSGSTGQPKGMVHTHRSGLAYARHAVDAHELDTGSRLAGTAPLHFDMSTLELYSVPLAGATALTISESDERFPATMSERLDSRAATHLYAVPSLLHQLIERGALDERKLDHIQHIAFAGEPMGPALLAKWMDRLPEATFLNAYGPAEVNVVTSHRFEPEWDRREVPIGRPWPGVRTRIVDESHTEVDDGEVGELLVAAESCMRGYWQQEEETASRMTTDASGLRWYHTGDLVRRADGSFHFHGRRDNQVKVRGVRIEVEAVEHVVCAEPSVAQAIAACVVDPNGLASLRVWVVPAPDADVEERRVIRWCRARLAAAAVPSVVSVVDALPISPNGKLDRHAVAAWSATRP